MRCLVSACVRRRRSRRRRSPEPDPPVHAGNAGGCLPVVAGDPPLPPGKRRGRRAVSRLLDRREVAARSRRSAAREIELQMFPPAPAATRGSTSEPSPEAGSRHVAHASPRKPSELRPDGPVARSSLELPDLPIVWSQKLRRLPFVFYSRPIRRGSARSWESWLTAQSRYRDMVLGYLRKAHLPQDLPFYVAMIERRLRSRRFVVGRPPSGLWQFHAGRAGGSTDFARTAGSTSARDPYRSTMSRRWTTSLI